MQREDGKSQEKNGELQQNIDPQQIRERPFLPDACDELHNRVTEPAELASDGVILPENGIHFLLFWRYHAVTC